MGITLMVILFVVGVIATTMMVSPLSSKDKNRANDPEAGSRPGTSQQGPPSQGLSSIWNYYHRTESQPETGFLSGDVCGKLACLWIFSLLQLFLL